MPRPVRLSVLLFISLSSLHAQTLVGPIQMIRAVGGKVVTLKGEPIPGAVVMIDNNFGAHFQIETTDRSGEFHYEYITADAIRQECIFTVAVQKKNYRAAHRRGSDESTGKQVGMLITMLPLHEDPDVLSSADLIQGVAPRLRQLSAADGLAAKYTKDYTRAAQEFLDRKHVENAVPLFEKVAKQNPSCVRCRTMLGLAELSWGNWDDGSADLAQAVNAMLADKHLSWAEPMIAHGVLESWDHQPARAAPYFQEALKYSPHDVLALQELGRAECQNSNWEAASETLQKAVDAGAGPQAHLLLARALVWAGTAKQAKAELNIYLHGRDLRTMPVAVRTLSQNIAEKQKDAAAYSATLAKLRAHGQEPLDYIARPPRNLANFTPAVDQSPLPEILKGVGNRVAEIYKDLPNTSSEEKIRQESLNRAGEARWGLNQKFRYLCLIPQLPWGPSVDEYRMDSLGNLAVPTGLKQDLMLTSGFLGAALIFHPAYQSGNRYRYLGRQKNHGRDYIVLAFAQEPARSKIYGSFKVGSDSKLTYVQGLAWIDAETLEITRLKTDLLYPLPKFKLDTETTDIDFREVQFASVSRKFWLPHLVTVELDWSGRRLRNRHEYSDYLVFNVEEKHKIGVPTAEKLPPARHPGR